MALILQMPGSSGLYNGYWMDLWRLHDETRVVRIQSEDHPNRHADTALQISGHRLYLLPKASPGGRAVHSIEDREMRIFLDRICRRERAAGREILLDSELGKFRAVCEAAAGLEVRIVACGFKRKELDLVWISCRRRIDDHQGEDVMAVEGEGV